MNREDFVNHKFKGYDIVLYKNDRMKNWDGGLGVEFECLVCCINFDEEIILLQPVDSNVLENDEFWANIKHIEFPIPKPRLKTAPMLKENRNDLHKFN